MLFIVRSCQFSRIILNQTTVQYTVDRRVHHTVFRIIISPFSLNLISMRFFNLINMKYFHRFHFLRYYFHHKLASRKSHTAQYCWVCVCVRCRFFCLTSYIIHQDVLAVKICLWHNVAMLIDLYFINNSSLQSIRISLFSSLLVFDSLVRCLCKIFDLRKCHSEQAKKNTQKKQKRKKVRKRHKIGEEDEEWKGMERKKQVKHTLFTYLWQSYVCLTSFVGVEIKRRA